MYAIDKHMLSTSCVQLCADQMALERPLGRAVQREWESSRGCALWLLVVGLGSEMALYLEKGWYQMVNEMGPWCSPEAQGRDRATSEFHIFQGVTAE